MLSAYRVKTIAQQKLHFTTFLQFLEFHKIDLSQVDHLAVVAFIEFLVAENLKSGTIAGYIASIRSMFRLFNMSLEPLNHHWISLLLKSVVFKQIFNQILKNG